MLNKLNNTKNNVNNGGNSSVNVSQLDNCKLWVGGESQPGLRSM